MYKMMQTIHTLMMVSVTFVSLIIPSNLHLCVIVREVDGTNIKGRYDVITLLYISRCIFVSLFNRSYKFNWIAHVQSLNELICFHISR